MEPVILILSAIQSILAICESGVNIWLVLKRNKATQHSKQSDD